MRNSQNPKSIVQMVVFTGIILLMTGPALAPAQPELDTMLLSEHNAQSRLWNSLMDHDNIWFKSPEAQQIAENMMLYQRESGGWPKNIDFTAPVTREQIRILDEYPKDYRSTIDNGATYTQLFFLAKLINVTGDERYVLSFLKGLDYLLEAQYDNGGWPQFYPLVRGYYSHITYNDDAMVGVLYLLRDVVNNTTWYGFVDSVRRERARSAVHAGAQCILNTQIKVDGNLTGWCAQYDEKTLQPAPARAYELVSLSGKATVGILRFLMSLDEPSPKVIAAIQGGVAWLDQVRIQGIRQIRVPDASAERGFNKIVKNDPNAPSLWARFYEIGSNKPFFSDRDGKVYQNMSEISSERRNAYGWLGDWPAELLAHDYPIWVKKWSPGVNVLKTDS